MQRLFSTRFWKWCVTRAQLLAFVLLVVIALSGTIAYESTRLDDFREQVNLEVQVLTKALTHAVPGANVHVSQVRHKNGSVTITQNIVRSINVPPGLTK